MTYLLVALYVGSAIVANSAIAWFGPWVAPFSAFLLIGLTMACRDRLHDLWNGQHLKRRMAMLIVGMSALSALINPATERIAAASACAFFVSETVDALVFHRLLNRSWFVRSNGSNAVSALVDSIVFLTLAFGAFMPLVILTQWAAKIGGSGLWSWIVRRRAPIAAVAMLALLALPARAQIVSIDGGVMQTTGNLSPVAEGFVATPVVAGFRLFGLTTLRLGTTQLSYQAQLTHRLLGPLSVTGGALFLPFRAYRPRGIGGFQLTVPLWANLSLIGVASTAPADRWSRTYLLKLSATGWFRR